MLVSPLSIQLATLLKTPAQSTYWSLVLVQPVWEQQNVSISWCVVHHRHGVATTLTHSAGWAIMVDNRFQ